jgi:nucleolar protein 9
MAQTTQEIQPDLSTLLHDPFASHVLRALIALLVPQIAPPPSADLTRSRKSSKWKAKQGPMNSMFSAEELTTEQPTLVPPSFEDLSRALLLNIRQKLDENEVRALGASKVAAPLLRLLLALEAHLQFTDQPGSLMDSLLSGIITLSRQSSLSRTE